MFVSTTIDPKYDQPYRSPKIPQTDMKHTIRPLKDI